MKIKDIREAVEINKNMHLPEKTPVHAEVTPAYATAVESSDKFNNHKEEVIRKLMKKAKTTVPKDAPSPSTEKNTVYTKKTTIELDESLFADSDEESSDDDDENKHKLLEVNGEELEQRKKKLIQKTAGKLFKDYSEEERKEYLEIACISMINSIIAYTPGAETMTPEEVLASQEKSYHNYLQEYTDKLGRNKILELIKGQLEDIVTVHSGVYMDSEGGSYNSIGWKKKSVTEATKLDLLDPENDVYNAIYNRLFLSNKNIVPNEKVKVRKFITSESPILGKKAEQFEKISDDVYASKFFVERPIYDERQSFDNFVNTPGHYSIGVRLENEKQGNLVKAVADYFGFNVRTEKDKDFGSDIFKVLMIIEIPEEAAQQNFEIFKKQNVKNESLMQDIHDAYTNIEKEFGKEVTKDLDEFSETHPNTNYFFSVDGWKEFIEWGVKNKKNPVYKQELDAINNGKYDFDPSGF